MTINHLILKKIDSLDAPEKIKSLLKLMLENEEQLEIHGTKKDFFRNYDNILDKFVKDDEIIKFCESYE